MPGEGFGFTRSSQGFSSRYIHKDWDIVFNQSLNYIGIPFKCNRCQCYGHLISNCHFSLKKNYNDELKSNFTWRVKKPMLTAVFDEVGIVSAQTRAEGFDISCKETDISGIKTLKPLSLSDARVNDGISDEGFMSAPPLRDMGFISPVKTISKTGYFLRSCTKFHEKEPGFSSFEVRNGITGLSSASPPLKQNDRTRVIGALRVVQTPVLVT